MLSWWPTVSVGKCVLSIYDGKKLLYQESLLLLTSGKTKLTHESIPLSLVNVNL